MAKLCGCSYEMPEGQCSRCNGLEKPIKVTPIGEVRAGELYDYAVNNPKFTSKQCCLDLQWTEHMFTDAVRILRQILAGDTINLAVDPEGTSEWIYKLVGTVDEAMPWATIRLQSVESQLATLLNVAESLVLATDLRSRDGKRARLIASQIDILQRQLDVFVT